MIKQSRRFIIVLTCLTLLQTLPVFAAPSQDYRDRLGIIRRSYTTERFPQVSSNDSVATTNTTSSNTADTLSQNKVINTANTGKYLSVQFMHLPFDEERRVREPQFYETGMYTRQGVNSEGWQGTCGEVAIATVMNRLFDTNAYTENNVLAMARTVGCCMTTYDNKFNGGISPNQVLILLASLSEATGDRVSAYFKVNEETPRAVEIAQLLNEGKQVILSVASSKLFELSEEEAQRTTYTGVNNSDHWLVVTEPVYDNNQDLKGFYVVDSSGYNATYVSLEKFNNMTYGPSGTDIKLQAAVIVERQ